MRDPRGPTLGLVFRFTRKSLAPRYPLRVSWRGTARKPTVLVPDESVESLRQFVTQARLWSPDAVCGPEPDPAPISGEDAI
jgi:hypothetical protein